MGLAPLFLRVAAYGNCAGTPGASTTWIYYYSSICSLLGARKRCTSIIPAPYRLNEREKIEEPYVQVDMITPEEYVGTLMELCQNRRGIFKDMKYLTQGTTLSYEFASGSSDRLF